MSSSPHNQPSESGSSEQNLQFKAENIGHWTKQQEDPFAAQNRKKEAKKQKSAATRKKAMPYIIIAAAVIVVGLIVWGVIALVNHLTQDPDAAYTPEISGSSEADIVEYRGLLQEFYDRKKNEQSDESDTVDDTDLDTSIVPNNDPEEDKDLILAVAQVVQNTLDTSKGRENANAVLCAQVYFYYNNGYYQAAVDVLPQIDIDSLDNNVKSNLYEAAANSYYWLNNDIEADKYRSLLWSIPIGGMNDEN